MRPLDLRRHGDRGVDERGHRRRPVAIPMPQHDKDARRHGFGQLQQPHLRVGLVHGEQRRQGKAQP